MKCPHCGAELPDQSKFCKYCGEQIEKSSETVKNSKKDSSSGKKILLSVLLCALLGTGVWLGYTYLFNGKSNSAEESSIEEMTGNDGTLFEDNPAEPEISAAPYPEHMNAILEKIRQSAVGDNKEIIFNVLRSEEFNTAAKEMWTMKLDKVVIHDGDSKAVAAYFTDEQFVIYSGEYDWISDKREGYGELFGVNVIVGDLPFKEYSAGGEWENDKPDGEWTVNCFLRTGENGEGSDIAEHGSVRNGLWNGQYYYSGPEGERIYRFNDGIIHVYDYFYENGMRYGIVEYMNDGYVYMDEDLITDIRGIIGYARGN